MCVSEASSEKCSGECSPGVAAEHEVVTGRERARGAGSGEDESSGVSELEKAFQVQAQGYLCTDISGISSPEATKARKDLVGELSETELS